MFDTSYQVREFLISHLESITEDHSDCLYERIADAYPDLGDDEVERIFESAIGDADLVLASLIGSLGEKR